MSLAEIGLPSSLPLPLPKVDWRRVAIVLSSAAAPGVDGAGRTMPCFNMPSLRRVSKERPGVLSNRAASFASRTDISVPSAPTRAAPASLSPVMYGLLDRKSVVLGKSVSVRVDLGGGRFIKKKKN